MRSLTAGAVLVILCANAAAFELKGLTLGAKTSPEQVQAAMGVQCGVGADEMQVCNGQTTIGGVWGEANIVIAPSGKLQRIHFTFDSNSFESLADAFGDKYGKHTTKRTVVQNGFGTKAENVEKVWGQKNGDQLKLRKNDVEIGKAVASYTTPEDRALLRRIYKADKSDL